MPTCGSARRPLASCRTVTQIGAPVRVILSADVPDVNPLLPTGIYTIPEASMVGESEESLTRAGVDYVAGKARYLDCPRGRILGYESGFLKLLFRRDDMKLLGVHVVGEQATELVHIGMVAMMYGADATHFDRACFNYPTLADLYRHAAYDAMLTPRSATREAK